MCCGEKEIMNSINRAVSADWHILVEILHQVVVALLALFV